MTRHEKLEALWTEANRKHAYFSKRANRAEAINQGLNIAIATTAVAIAATSGAELARMVTITLGVALFALLGFNLLLKDRNRDTGLRSLIGAWRQHRIDTARLIQRNNAATADDADAAGIDKEIAQFEHRIKNTRIDETLYQPTRGPEPDAPTRNGFRNLKGWIGGGSAAGGTQFPARPSRATSPPDTGDGRKTAARHAGVGAPRVDAQRHTRPSQRSRT